MSLPQLLKKSADKLLSAYCAEQNRHREKPRTRLSYRIASNRVTLLEERHCCSCPSACHTRPVAQFRYQQDLMQWTLHYFGPGRNWVFYLNFGPNLDLSKILRHVDKDPFGMFWN
jgi:hypothetical protein